MHEIIKTIWYSRTPINLRKSINLTIDNKDILGTLEKLNENENFNLSENILSLRPIDIKYTTEEGYVGIDATGLSKDFFTNIGDKMKNHMKLDEQYLIPNNEELNPVKWQLLGGLIARSIFSLNVSPKLNLSPVLCYFLLKGNYKIKVNDLLDTLLYFDIDFLDNIRKVQKMTQNEYIEFLELQGEENFINKDKYIFNAIRSKYVNDATMNFMNGFLRIIKNFGEIYCMNIISFCKIMAGDDKYKIKTGVSQSLYKSLHVEIEYTCPESSNKYFYIQKYKKISDVILEVFIDVLEELNTKNLNKLKTFIKFWFGTDTIINFDAYHPILVLDKSFGTYNCFRSCTCFVILSVNQTDILKNIGNKQTLMEIFHQLIDASLTNQSLMESVGMYMQTE